HSNDHFPAGSDRLSRMLAHGCLLRKGRSRNRCLTIASGVRGGHCSLDFWGVFLDFLTSGACERPGLTLHWGVETPRSPYLLSGSAGWTSPTACAAVGDLQRIVMGAAP